MNQSGDAAETVVRMSLQGTEVGLKVVGEGAKYLIAGLYSVIKNHTQTRGKTRLVNMLKSGRPLKVFTIKEEDLKKFAEESKKYGVLYCALKKKGEKSFDGMVDILVREEDAAKINRIVDRFNLSTINRSEVESIIGKDNVDKAVKDANDRGVQVKTLDDIELDEILGKPIQKESSEPSNSNLAKSEVNHQSKSISKNKKDLVTEDTKTVSDKPSVKKELKEIKEEQLKNENKKEQPPKEKNNKQQYKNNSYQAKNKSKNKRRER